MHGWFHPCFFINMKKGNKYSLEEWKEKCTRVHNGLYNYDKIEQYINQQQKMNIYCTKHNLYFQQTAKAHLNGYSGCPCCVSEKIQDKKLLSISEIKARLEDKTKNSQIEFDFSTYKNITYPFKAICHNIDEHGNEHGEFWPRPYNILNGHGCPKCGIEKNSNSCRTQLDVFLEKVKKIHPKLDFSLVTSIKNVEEKILVICHEKDEFGEEHGIFETTPHRLLLGQGCIKCANLNKITVDVWKKHCNKIHNGKYNYDNVNFSSVKERVDIVCLKHGHFQQTACNHWRGHGCPICANSRLEEKMCFALNDNGIEYLTNDKSILGGLELDFYIPSKRIAIECQGIQHFVPRSFGSKNKEKVLENFEKQIERTNGKVNYVKKKGLN